MSADVSVRLAWPDDVPAISALQAEAWNERLSGLTGGTVDDPVAPETLAPPWEALISRPPDARVRALVALERSTVRGFALVSPADDPDADPVADGLVAEFVIDARHRGAGHGSRLVQAAMDTLRADGFGIAHWWVDSTDDALRSFVVASGWAADGAHRELATDDHGATVRQVRLHTDLTADE